MSDLAYNTTIATGLTNAQDALTAANAALVAALAAEPQVPATITAAYAAIVTATDNLAAAQALYYPHKADVDAVNLDAHLTAADAALVVLLRQIGDITSKAKRHTTYRMSQEIKNYVMVGRVA